MLEISSLRKLNPLVRYSIAAVVLCCLYPSAKYGIEFYVKILAPRLQMGAVPECAGPVLTLKKITGPCAGKPRPPLLFLDVHDSLRLPADLKKAYPFSLHPNVRSRFPVKERIILTSDFRESRALLRLENGLVFAFIPSTHMSRESRYPDRIDYVAMRRVTQRLRFEAEDVVILLRHRGTLWSMPEEAVIEVGLVSLVHVSEPMFRGYGAETYGVFSRSSELPPPDEYQTLYQPTESGLYDFKKGHP